MYYMFASKMEEKMCKLQISFMLILSIRLSALNLFATRASSLTLVVRGFSE